MLFLKFDLFIVFGRGTKLSLGQIMTQAHEMDESCANLIETTILEEFSCRGHKTKPAARKLPWIHEIGESRTEQH